MTENIEHSVEESPVTKKKRILLAEDDSTTRLFLFNQLKKRGLEVETAPNGNLALKKLKTGNFDGVILDMMLSGIKGKELIKVIRKRQPDLPIFVVTSAERMDLWRKRLSKAGATKVIDKGAPIAKIVGEIVRYLIPKPEGAQKATEVEQEVEAEPSPVPETAPKPVETKEKAPKRGNTGFSRKPVSPVAPNTDLLRKIAQAGHAARGTPPPVSAPPLMSSDTPLMSEDTPPEIADLSQVEESSTAPVSANTETSADIETRSIEIPSVPTPVTDVPKATPVLPEPVVARERASSSSSYEVRELEEQLAELRRNRDHLAQMLRDQPVFSSSSSEPDAAVQEKLDEANAATRRVEAAYQAELARSRQFEEELKRIRETRDELNRKLAEDEKAAEETRRRSEELEQHLAQSMAQLEEAKAALQKNAAEHAALETELRNQVTSARQSADGAKVAYEEQAARAQSLTEEIEMLRKAREELNARLKAEMKKAAESKRRIEEREQQLREKEAEVKHLKSELKRRSADNELSKKLNEAVVAAENAQAVYKEEAARGVKVDKELALLNTASEELNAKLAREEQAAADARRRSEEMEQQLAVRNAELDRLKSDLTRHAEERKALEQQLEQQVAQASDAAARVRREFQEGTKTFRRSSEDVQALRQARDQLNATLEREQQTASQTRRDSEAVEAKLQTAAQEIAQLRSELEKRATPQALPAAGTDVKDSPAPAPAAKPRTGFAARILAPFRGRSSRPEEQNIRHLEEQLADVTRNRDELLVLLRDQPIPGRDAAGAGKPETVAEAKAATKRAEAAYHAEFARSRQFEEELKRIRQARDELNRKLTEEEKEAEESRRRSKELEERLTQSAAEVAQAKAELQRSIAEHSALEADLRQQLDSSRQFAEHAQLAVQKQVVFVQRSTEELEAMRRAREELNARLNAETQAAAESSRSSEEREQELRTRQAEVDRLKAELVHRAADKALAAKLSTAERAAQSAQAAYQQEAARGAQSKQQLARLSQAREELNARLAREEQAGAEARRRTEGMEREFAVRTDELNHLKAELRRHGEERKVLEQKLQQQVAEASNTAQRVRRDFQQETSFFRRSSEEVEALRRARDELNARFEREQQAAVESRRHSEELESKLQAATQELAGLRAELEKHSNERASLVTDSSRQLQAAKTAAAQAEKAYNAQLKRSEQFEKELAALRQAPAGGKGKGRGSKSQQRIQELEEQAAAHAAKLEKARAEFEQQVQERQRLESEHRAAREKSAAQKSQNALAAADARFRESIAGLARVTAQLEKEQVARKRVEDRATFLAGQLQYLQGKLQKHIELEKETYQRITEFEQQVRERDGEVTKAVVDLQKEAAARQLVQVQLKATGDMGSQFQEQFNLLDEAKRVFNAAQEKLQARLESTVTAHKESELELQRLVAERKRVQELVEDAQRKFHEKAQQHAEQMGQLQSSLEMEAIERRKKESQALQSQFASLDASRFGRAFVNSFRTHLRPSADQLLERTRRLLELPLKDKQKKLVEAALESALLLQTSMQVDARLPGEAETTEMKKAA